MKTIKSQLYFVDREAKISSIKDALSLLKQELDNLRDYRGGWTDLDVAMVCWLLAHDKKELEFWREVELPEKIVTNSGIDGMFHKS